LCSIPLGAYNVGMRYPLLAAGLASLVSLLQASLVQAVAATAPLPQALPALPVASLPKIFRPSDEAFDIRVDLLEMEKGTAAAYSFAKREMARTHDVHCEAVCAEYLDQTGGQGLSDPPDPRGVAMALEAVRGGSVRGLSVLGWDLLWGKLTQQDIGRGMDYLQRGAAAGDPKAMRYFGTANLAAGRLAAAEYWIRAAAYRGEPVGLLLLAAVEESGGLGGTPDLPAACRYDYLAYIYGYRDARIHLKQLADKGAPGAKRYNSMVIIWRAAHGHRTLSSDSVAQAAAFLETSFPADPEVLDALGLLYENGYGKGFMDFDKAMALFEKAAALGSQDARSHRAHALAEGIGCKRNPSAALAEWRALERLDNADALAWLGYYSFWGDLKGAGLGKNAFLAYEYSRRAAEAGDPFGALNLANSYADGIGVARNYALAAEYFRVALNCHVVDEGYARRMVDRCLAFAE